jgi:hypothetical protein
LALYREVAADAEVAYQGAVEVPGAALWAKLQMMLCGGEVWFSMPTREVQLVRSGLAAGHSWTEPGADPPLSGQLLCVNDTPFMVADVGGGAYDARERTVSLWSPRHGDAWRSEEVSGLKGTLRALVATDPARGALWMLTSDDEVDKVDKVDKVDGADARDLILVTLRCDVDAAGAPQCAMTQRVGEVASTQGFNALRCGLRPDGLALCAVDSALFAPLASGPPPAPALNARAQAALTDALARLDNEARDDASLPWVCGPRSGEGDWLIRDGQIVSCQSSTWSLLADALDARCEQPDPALAPHCPWLRAHFGCVYQSTDRDLAERAYESSPWRFGDFTARPCMLAEPDATTQTLTYMAARWPTQDPNLPDEVEPPTWARLTFSRASTGWALDAVEVLPPASAPSPELAGLVHGLPTLCAAALKRADDAQANASPPPAAPGAALGTIDPTACQRALADLTGDKPLAPIPRDGLLYGRTLTYCHCPLTASAGYLIRWRRGAERWWPQSVEATDCSSSACY